MLMPALESPRVQTVIEYSQADEQATMTVRYNGKPYDALENGDALSKSLLVGITAEIAYEAAVVDSYTNALTLVFTGQKG